MNSNDIEETKIKKVLGLVQDFYWWSFFSRSCFAAYLYLEIGQPSLPEKTFLAKIFFVPINIEKFKIRPCIIFGMFFILVKSKCVVFWPGVRLGRLQAYVTFFKT
ncbi:hypothetical protein GYH30_028211 [Glycine max]|nr:hypothetical protein GYH30_028211 [Glycine max]